MQGAGRQSLQGHIATMGRCLKSYLEPLYPLMPDQQVTEALDLTTVKK